MAKNTTKDGYTIDSNGVATKPRTEADQKNRNRKNRMTRNLQIRRHGKSDTAAGERTERRAEGSVG